jgi:acetylglutamate kinase
VGSAQGQHVEHVEHAAGLLHQKAHRTQTALGIGGAAAGFVGDLDESSIDRKGLYKLLEAGFTPVFSAITHDGKGQLLNTNADTIASAISIAMSVEYETSLIFCFEKAGVLMDVEDESSVIKSIDQHYYNELKLQGIINDGMIPKMDNAFEAINKGLKEVYIGKAEALPTLSNGNFGTRLISR